MMEIQRALFEVGGIHSRWSHTPLPETMLRQEIANGRPGIVGLTNTFSRHVIISGDDGTGYHVQVPYSGEFTSVPYANILNNPTIGNWSDSLYEMPGDMRCISYF